MEKVIGPGAWLQDTANERSSLYERQSVPEDNLVSEIGSLSLEFTRLTQLTKNPKYFDAVQRISNRFEIAQNSTRLAGMWPVTIDTSQPDFGDDITFTLNGLADSAYEYLPKVVFSSLGEEGC